MELPLGSVFFFFFLGSVFLTLTTVATRLGAQCRVLMSQVDSGS